MNKGAIILIVLALVAALVIVIARPILFEKTTRSTSNSQGATETIKIGGDDYGGYWFLTSPTMKKTAPRAGFTIDFTNDGGAYAERLKKFSQKEYDAIVLPINSYLQHGAKYNFPGVVVAAISESRGADAIVGFPDLMENGEINELNTADNNIVFTGESPSSFLLDLMITDFGMEELQNDSSWRRDVNGAAEVYKAAKMALKDRTKGDAFVLWEPYVTQAIEKLGYQQLWGSDQFGGYIIDVMVVHRDFVKKKGPLLQKFLKTYFRTVDMYAGDQEELSKQMGKSMHLNKKAVSAMMDKIEWFDLQENCSELFGIQVSASMPADDKIYSSIIQCGNVMENTGTFDNSDLRDPYIIVNSTFLEDLNRNNVPVVKKGDGSAVSFNQVSDNDWKKMKVIGTMRIKPISFQSGTNSLDYDGKEVVDKVATLLKVNYPGYRVAVRGHTGPGDAEANMELSEQRAQVVAQRLIAVHGIDPNRLHAEGYGATVPPKKKAGESMRALRFRMPRVEFVLLEENKL